MKVFAGKDGYLIRLVRGEEVHASLTAWAATAGCEGAVLTGLGAVEDVELGFYHRDRREYERRVERGPLELLSLDGNLSVVAGNPVLHAHVVLMRDDFTLAGGHLFRARIAVTGEIAVALTDLRLTRRQEEEVGLPLLEMSDP
jgi:predicted DNA-binding protein with PD1-like motif